MPTKKKTTKRHKPSSADAGLKEKVNQFHLRMEKYKFYRGVMKDMALTIGSLGTVFGGAIKYFMEGKKEKTRAERRSDRDRDHANSSAAPSNAPALQVQAAKTDPAPLVAMKGKGAVQQQQKLMPPEELFGKNYTYDQQEQVSMPPQLQAGPGYTGTVLVPSAAASETEDHWSTGEWAGHLLWLGFGCLVLYSIGRTLWGIAKWIWGKTFGKLFKKS